MPQGLSDEQVLFLSDIFPTSYMAAAFCNIQEGDTIAIRRPVCNQTRVSAWRGPSDHHRNGARAHGDGQSCRRGTSSWFLEGAKFHDVKSGCCEFTQGTQAAASAYPYK